MAPFYLFGFLLTSLSRSCALLGSPQSDDVNVCPEGKAGRKLGNKFTRELRIKR